jgi:hypothetical protein
MNKAILAMSLGICCAIGSSDANATAVQHHDKTVSLLETDAVNSCFFFQLSGVLEANPIVPNGIWFAVDKNGTNAKEMYAILLSARLTGNALTRVLTNGEVVCGQAKVVTIDL